MRLFSSQSAIIKATFQHLEEVEATDAERYEIVLLPQQHAQYLLIMIDIVRLHLQLTLAAGTEENDPAVPESTITQLWNDTTKWMFYAGQQ